MRMYDLIEKKKNGQELSTEEIRWMIFSRITRCLP